MTQKAQQEAISFHATQDPISGDVAPSLGANASIGVFTVRTDQTGSNGLNVSEDISPTLDKGVAPAVGPLDHASFAENQRGEIREMSTVARLATGGGKPGQGYPAARVGSTVRRLTPTECERLMGWPDGWTLLDDTDDPNPRPDGRRYAACGDGVVAPVAEWIGRRLRPFVETAHG